MSENQCTFTPDQARDFIKRCNDPRPPRERYVLGARHRKAPDLHELQADNPEIVAAVLAALAPKPEALPCQRRCFTMGLRERHERRGICPCQQVRP